MFLRFNFKSIFILSLGIFLLTSCRISRSVKKTKQPPAVETIHIGHIDKHRKAIVEEAYTWLGTPYRYASQEKGRGADCSGMVMVVYETVIGEKLPRNSAMQADYCKRLEPNEVSAGDLVFFATGKDASKISHVGIVVDNEYFIHASSSKGVIVSQFSNNYYQRTFKMFGRVPCMSK